MDKSSCTYSVVGIIEVIVLYLKVVTLQEQIEQLILESIPHDNPTDAEIEALADKLMELYQRLPKSVNLDSAIRVSIPTEDNPILAVDSDPIFLLEQEVESYDLSDLLNFIADPNGWLNQ